MPIILFEKEVTQQVIRSRGTRAITPHNGLLCESAKHKGLAPSSLDIPIRLQHSPDYRQPMTRLATEAPRNSGGLTALALSNGPRLCNPCGKIARLAVLGSRFLQKDVGGNISPHELTVRRGTAREGRRHPTTASYLTPSTDPGSSNRTANLTIKETPDERDHDRSVSEHAVAPRPRRATSSASTRCGRSSSGALRPGRM